MGVSQYFGFKFEYSG
ncbi:binfunctional sulfate adenylyltransferase subunit 1/adenylylsulfate kinase protein [Sulfitobacter sp. EE-36]|nr:binfunctional sulfate adenylyltransferase subunit 1/adenylylsulfate kinase protein [Sulfitobacter sp. EE-36]